MERLSIRPKEAARLLGISSRTLWALTSPRGPIPCVRLGAGKKQIILYPVQALKQWLNQQAKTKQDQSDNVTANNEEKGGTKKRKAKQEQPGALFFNFVENGQEKGGN